MSQANNAAVETLPADIGSTHGEAAGDRTTGAPVAAASGSGVTEWSNTAASCSHTQFFCGVFAHPNHVTVEFGQGHRLEDCYHQLEGSGEYRRHIKLYSPDEVKQASGRLH